MCPPEDHDGTVVMATRDRAGRASATVSQLLAGPRAWPVVVVDDASRDDTSTTLRRRFHDRIELVTLGRNRGAAARTEGVQAAGAPVVAFCDDDSWWDPDSLERAARVLRDHPDVGLVAATVLVEPGGRPDPIVGELRHSPLEHRSPGPSVLGFLACGAVVRRTAYLEVGGFEPLLHLGGEEELLALDLRAAGWRVVHVPEVVAHHRPDPADAHRSGRVVRQARNRLLVHWMRRPAQVALHATWAALRRAHRDPVERRALGEALLRLPAALRRRRRLPPVVEAEVRRLEDGR